MSSTIRVYQSPAQSLALALADVCRVKGIAWTGARAEVANVSGLSVGDVEAIERGALPDVDTVARLGTVGGLVNRDATPIFMGFRAAGVITRAVGDGGEVSYHFTMSTASVDRANDIVNQDWILGDFDRNPVAFYNHNTWGLPIGRWANVGGQPLTGDFIPYRPKSVDMHPLAATVADMLDQGQMHACSVGFMPSAAIPRSSLDRNSADYAPNGLVFMSPRLLECSIVGIPMNGEACRPPAERKPAEKSLSPANQSASPTGFAALGFSQ